MGSGIRALRGLSLECVCRARGPVSVGAIIEPSAQTFYLLPATRQSDDTYATVGLALASLGLLGVAEWRRGAVPPGWAARAE